jgi:hypothetical protein
MLGERLTRSYFMLGQGVNVARVRRQFDADLAAFEADMATLRGLPLNPPQQQNLAKVGQSWARYKAAAAREPGLVNARGLALASADLGRAAAADTAGLKSLVVDRFDAVGLAGSVRTLSQRMAKLYYYATWGVKAPEGADDLAALAREYRSSMDSLGVAPQNDESTLADLALAQSQWVFFSAALTRLGTGDARRQSMADVGKTSDALLEVLDGLSRKYAMSTEQDWAN